MLEAGTNKVQEWMREAAEAIKADYDYWGDVHLDHIRRIAQIIAKFAPGAQPLPARPAVSDWGSSGYIVVPPKTSEPLPPPTNEKERLISYRRAFLAHLKTIERETGAMKFTLDAMVERTAGAEPLPAISPTPQIDELERLVKQLRYESQSYLQELKRIQSLAQEDWKERIATVRKTVEIARAAYPHSDKWLNMYADDVEDMLKLIDSMIWPKVEEAVSPTPQEEDEREFYNETRRVMFRAGLLVCRGYMARFVEAESPSIAASIRANWWPSLGPDPGPPRKLRFDEVTDGGEEGPWLSKPIDPSVEALPVALARRIPMSKTTECNPTEHNFLQVGTNDQTTKVVCTKCGKCLKV